MPTPNNSEPRHYFGRVDLARKKMAERAEQYVDLHLKATRNAAERGNADPAQWALSHIAVLNEQGQEIRPIAGSVDRQAPEASSTGTKIFIGLGLGADFDRLLLAQRADTVRCLPALNASDPPTEE